MKGGVIIMRDEYVGKLFFVNLKYYMDCRSEGSGDSDCDCDMVDGS